MSENYISALSDIYGAEVHKHLMLELFMKCDGDCQAIIEGNLLTANCILIDSNVEHTIAEKNQCGFVMFIDPVSSIAKQLQYMYIKGKKFCILNLDNIQLQLKQSYNNLNAENIKEFERQLFGFIKIDYHISNQYDDRISRLLEILDKGGIEYSIPEISEAICLSPSRISHLFKEQVGVSLKSYLQYRRLVMAYRLLFQGKSITEAALMTGFDSPSHLAATNKKMTGLSASELLKD